MNCKGKTKAQLLQCRITHRKKWKSLVAKKACKCIGCKRQFRFFNFKRRK